MFFYVSLVLVIVAAITLVVGLLSSGLPLVIVSIASSFLAGVFLILTVMRDRPRPEAAGARGVPAHSGAESGGRAGADEEFPIADYDDLKVGEIVPLLPELDDDELETVREREAAGKKRATILGRIDELLAEGELVEEDEGEEEEEPPVAAEGADVGFPIADYDDLKVGEIVPLLSELDDDELETVYDREEAGKARARILGRIDELFGEEVAPVKSAPAPAKKAATKKAPAKKTAVKKTASGAKAGFPVAGYDTLSAADIAKNLKKLDGDQLKAVRTYEKRKKARKGVLAKIESELTSR